MFRHGFYLNAVASVTLDPNGNYFLCPQKLSRLKEFCRLPLRLVATGNETHSRDLITPEFVWIV
jgi:hypothetical protein